MRFQERQKTRKHREQQEILSAILDTHDSGRVAVVTSSFSDRNSVFKQYRFEIVPRWRAFLD